MSDAGSAAAAAAAAWRSWAQHAGFEVLDLFDVELEPDTYVLHLSGPGGRKYEVRIREVDELHTIQDDY